jgi:hypothetical protein
MDARNRFDNGCRDVWNRRSSSLLRHVSEIQLSDASVDGSSEKVENRFQGIGTFTERWRKIVGPLGFPERNAGSFFFFFRAGCVRVDCGSSRSRHVVQCRVG